MKPIACLLTLTLCSPVLSQIERCEGPNGKVVYSNEGCPKNTKVVREVDTRPPISEADARQAQARAKREAREVKDIEKQEAAEQKARERAQAAERKEESKQEKRCNRLHLAVRKAQDELDLATLKTREARRRALNRAQEAYDIECKE